jgi:integrase
MNVLTELEVKSLNTPGRHSVGDSLYLNVSAGNSKSWSWHYRVEGKRREVGLGSYPFVSCKEARKKKDALKVEVANGNDPLAEREAEKAERDRLRSMTFKKAAYEVHAVKQQEWKDGKHQDQWINTLRTYAFPDIGNMPVGAIEPQHVIACLNPIWMTKKETARRVMQRINVIMRWAKAMKYRAGDNPAAWEGTLEFILPNQKHEVSHHPALAFEDLPSFWTELSSIQTVSADALRFLILTAARSGEVRGANWDEINLEKALWSLPAARMKNSKPHRVPLCEEAMVILDKRRRLSTCKYIFEGQKPSRPISDMAMLSLMRKRFPELDAVPHGFRSTFRDWAENQSYPHRAVEYCLAHSVKNKTEAAYQRDDLLSIRRNIMTNYGSMAVNQKS